MRPGDAIWPTDAEAAVVPLAPPLSSTVRFALQRMSGAPVFFNQGPEASGNRTGAAAVCAEPLAPYPNLVLTPLKSASVEIRTSSFVNPSQIFVWEIGRDKVRPTFQNLRLEG
jgi:hypothetical protein